MVGFAVVGVIILVALLLVDHRLNAILKELQKLNIK